jgi:plastocyanin
MANTNSKLHTMYIVVILVLLAVIAGGYYYFHKKTENVQMSIGKMMPAGSGQRMAQGGQGKGGMGGMMSAVTPPPMSDQQKQQLADGVATDSTKKTFNITGGNFYFVPNKITIHKGDEVTFVMTNAGGVHDLVIDDLGVKTPVIRTGQAVTATFTASKIGSFVYYCDIPGHKAKGMWGTLVVE